MVAAVSRVRLFVEIILGPLPATLLVLPFAMAGAAGTAFAAAAILADRAIPFSSRLMMLRGPGELMLWILSAVLGLSALWFAVLADEMEVPHRSRLRVVLILGLLVGIAAAVRWLFVMGRSGENYGRATWVTWIVLLLGPIVVGARHLFLLVTRRSGWR
jgi:hypothetical protein